MGGRLAKCLEVGFAAISTNYSLPVLGNARNWWFALTAFLPQQDRPAACRMFLDTGRFCQSSQIGMSQHKFLKPRDLLNW